MRALLAWKSIREINQHCFFDYHSISRVVSSMEITRGRAPHETESAKP